jgi:hypothetical protein
MTSFLHSLIGTCRTLAERLAEAAMTGPATSAGNYSYQAELTAGRNLTMMGDAFTVVAGFSRAAFSPR